jgi:hypothetical protein
MWREKPPAAESAPAPVLSAVGAESRKVWTTLSLITYGNTHTACRDVLTGFGALARLVFEPIKTISNIGDNAFYFVR